MRMTVGRSWLLLGVLVLSGITRVNADNAADLPIDSALLRMAIVVADVERSKRFYRDTLGYEVGFDGDITRPSVTAMLGLQPDQTAHFVVLRGAQELYGEPVQAAMIGLLSVANPPLAAMARPADTPLAVGEGMLAIMSSDIKRAHQRMLEQGIEVLFPPTKSADGSESEMVVYDPDGIRIHVVERHQNN